MRKFFDYLYKVVDFLVIISLLMIVLSVSVNVFSRYFGRAFTWIDEFSRLAFVWMSFMAIVAGMRRKMHPSFNVLIKKLDGIKGKIILTIINILILVFLLYVLKGGISYISRVHMQTTAILKISVAWKYSAVPLAAAIMAIEVLKRLFLIWKQEKVVIEHQTKDVI